MDEIRERAAGGGLLAGFPLSGVRIDVTDAQMQEEGSDEVAFRIAAGDAFDKGMEKAGLVLLEPVMKVEVTTPGDYMGELVGGPAAAAGNHRCDRNPWNHDRHHCSCSSQGTIWVLRCCSQLEPRAGGWQHGTAKLPACTQRRCRKFYVLSSKIAAFFNVAFMRRLICGASLAISCKCLTFL